MNQSVDIKDNIVKQYYPLVQGDKKAGKWIVFVYDADKGHKLAPYKLAIDSKKWAKTKKKKALKKALKEDGFEFPSEDESKEKEEAKEEEESAEENYPTKIDVVMVEDAEGDGKGIIPKGHHKAFTDCIKEAAKKYDRPVIGVLELLTKVYYVTFVPEESSWSDKCLKDKELKRKARAARMAFSTIRGNVKSDFATTNADIAATDNDGLEYEEFEKLGPKI